MQATKFKDPLDAHSCSKCGKGRANSSKAASPAEKKVFNFNLHHDLADLLSQGHYRPKAHAGTHARLVYLYPAPLFSLSFEQRSETLQAQGQCRHACPAGLYSAPLFSLPHEQLSETLQAQGPCRHACLADLTQHLCFNEFHLDNIFRTWCPIAARRG